MLDCLLAAAQGVTHYGLELAQTMHLIQDAAAIAACESLAQEYLAKKGYRDVFTPITSLHWMGAWPQDDAQAATLVSYGGTLAAIGGAASVTTKSTHEAHGIPTPQANVEGLRITRMAIYLARGIRLDGLPEYEREKDADRARGARDRRQGARNGRRRRGGRHGARVRGRRARRAVVAESPRAKAA